MPRVSRVKAKHHATAPQLPSKRTFAAAHVTETVLPGSGLSTPLEETSTGSGIFGIAPPVEAGPSKRPLFGNRAIAAGLPPIPNHPYSRSHLKREKKKAKQKLTALDDMGSALPRMEEEEEEDEAEEQQTLAAQAMAAVQQPQQAKPKPKVRDGVIGEGKGLGMKEKKKRKQIAIEAKRIPAILQHPAYKADPWATIRLHASNSLELKPVASVGTKADAAPATPTGMMVD